MHCAQFNSDFSAPIVSACEFEAHVDRKRDGSLYIEERPRPKRPLRSGAITLWRGRKSTISKCLDRTHRLTFIVPDCELDNFCRYLLEDAPRAVAFMYKYLEAMRGGV